MDQIAAAMRALEGGDAGSSDGALEDDFVLAATTVCACASPRCCGYLWLRCCCSVFAKPHTWTHSPTTTECRDTLVSFPQPEGEHLCEHL